MAASQLGRPSRVIGPTKGEVPGTKGDPGLHVVGLTGFEPAAPRPPAVCATKLRYSPMPG